MVNVSSRKCRTEGCDKFSSFGVAGTKTAEYCAQHASGGMVDVSSTKCRTEDCGKRPLFGVVGTKTAEYCTKHALDVMNRKLWQASAVWSVWYENGGVLRTTRPRRDGQRLQQKVQNQRLRQVFVVWSDRYENSGVLRTTCPGRDGERPQ
ncbi:unnamed protein product [Ascophyllum nodosum]